MIIIAVNEYGKAFVLGYQRIRSERELRDSFGSRLPAGEYIAHVDAIVEVPSSRTVYHAPPSRAEVAGRGKLSSRECGGEKHLQILDYS